MSKDRFEILLLIARPGAGKSEVIDYLKRTPLEERKSRFHIGEFEEIDDFPDAVDLVRGGPPPAENGAPAPALG